MKNIKIKKNKQKKIIIIGGKGNGTVIQSVINDCIKVGQKLKIIGYLNDKEKKINNLPVLGKIKKQEVFKYRDCYFIYALSNVKMAEQRYEILKKLDIPSKNLINIFHPSSIVADTSKLENGIVLMPNVVISPNCLINSHSQLYANSFVGHDTVLEEMVFVANNASVGGRVIVCKGAHIGSNSSIIERVKIGQYSVIGLGSVVLKNVLDKSIVAGNPAKYITRIHYTN